MTERPILFSAPMVRAILAGMKTQTRRVMRKQFCHDAEPEEMCATNERGHQTTGHSGLWWDATRGDPDAAARCPFGSPGERLWVREAFSGPHHQERHPPRDWHSTDPIHYWADGNPADGDWTKPRPGMFMPRWARRITLEVTAVRVERLHDISEADALAEGCVMRPARHCFEALWESINGADSWAANPWVWVIEFTPRPSRTTQEHPA